jgi:hypothetical protein
VASVTVAEGDASTWSGNGVDLIFTHPYAPLPRCLRGVPAIINLYHNPKVQRRVLIEIASGWVGAPLLPVGDWGKGRRNTVYVAGLPVAPVHIADLVEDEFEPGRGWFPLDLPFLLLGAYASPGMTIWDGFMGRGTVGKACQALGLGYVGLDIRPERVAIARDYLELA